MKHERRAYKRISDSLQIKFEVSNIDIIMPSTSYTKDISQGGFLFRTNNVLEVGSIINIKILLHKSDEFISSLAKVVRVEEIVEGKIYDIGINFINITDNDIEKLSKYVTNKL